MLLLKFIAVNALIISVNTFSFKNNWKLGNFCSIKSRIPNLSTTTALSATVSEAEPLMRIGHGFDIHRLIEGTKLVIGGVEIPFHLGADAHSDGDALYHSVVDSILGALALPDIGQLFPDNDPQWKGADSSVFMKEAYKRMTERGYKIGNLDVTLILQTPKVKDIKPAMKQNLVSLLHTTDSRVNIKARTHEKVDSIGESRSYACHVVVILEKC
mmetsp:Transcript_16390/g.22589  ORF Transcript_16390/g.22589 Transcript_16390/m.22589 type:complete len:214 (+) Transcript_16390:29-670(+)